MALPGHNLESLAHLSSRKLWHSVTLFRWICENLSAFGEEDRF